MSKTRLINYLIAAIVITATAGCDKGEKSVFGGNDEVIQSAAIASVTTERNLVFPVGQRTPIVLPITSIEGKNVSGLTFEAVATVPPATNEEHPWIAQVELKSLHSETHSSSAEGFLVEGDGFAGVKVQCTDSACSNVKTISTHWNALTSGTASLSGHKFSLLDSDD